MHGNGTIDGMKNILSNEDLSGGTALTQSNEFNIVTNEMDCYYGVNDDTCVLCDFNDRHGLKNTKTDGKLFENEKKIIITGMMQPEYLFPSWRCSDAEGFYSRINVISPKFYWTKFKDIKALDEFKKIIPSKFWELLMKDKVICKEKYVFKLKNDAIDVHERVFDEN